MAKNSPNSDPDSRDGSAKGVGDGSFDPEDIMSTLSGLSGLASEGVGAVNAFRKKSSGPNGTQHVKEDEASPSSGLARFLTPLNLGLAALALGVVAWLVLRRK